VEWYSSYSFCTSAVDGVSGQRHAPDVLCPRGKNPGTNWTGGLVGPRACLDTEVRGKSFCLGRDLTPIALSSSDTILTELPGSPNVR
jgi:hypothetical protein